MIGLLEPQWRSRESAHRARVQPWVSGRLERRKHGRTHPVDDFLFDYYPYSVNKLLSWHPGHGVELHGDVTQFEVDPAYRHLAAEPAGVTTDLEKLAPKADRLDLVIRLLAGTAARPAQLNCFGLHEWAMVYEAPEIRHGGYPLRLSAGRVTEIVDELGLRCTHIDAYRFFTPAALPLNIIEPTRANQPDLEQPGCLHANMDLYKYAMWFSPFIGSELVADCFELARIARTIDMRAAPYDLTDLGYEPICIETAEGRREYVDAQKQIAIRAQVLRAQLSRCFSALRAARADAPVTDYSRGEISGFITT
jgi:hypothetical protein